MFGPVVADLWPKLQKLTQEDDSSLNLPIAHSMSNKNLGNLLCLNPLRRAPHP